MVKVKKKKTLQKTEAEPAVETEAQAPKPKKRKVKKVKSKADKGRVQGTQEATQNTEKAESSEKPVCELCDGLIPSQAFKCRGCGQVIQPE
mmetsp:Transcript_20811/g.47557  ORF Transcript_20811/g.47557 Transcript_20811/m.47557 type:complete len:91 (+) Transcript_20811:90-362(+)|eukprot:CAMPEP_0197932134 /NCGR_PEP_ID=MMETSP1439-20131203/108121_1 /TAXON_ID=66791 /ORGANISM="Gonyaulax spinifera, Strain CCMP409" /LENGTH=90 /DNA_ID=CAMNT_0043554903 /DNA_START=62 /DNA_END=334 /DNA_ORIENTATION=+